LKIEVPALRLRQTAWERRRPAGQFYSSTPASRRRSRRMKSCCKSREVIYIQAMTVDLFKREVASAVKTYDKFVVCLEKTPEDFEASLNSLLQKAIKAYENRGEGMRHGIALDKQVTVILSQGDEARPLCGIYFNLHSPYQKDALPKTVKAIGKTPARGE
jgi:hypothetical protein